MNEPLGYFSEENSENEDPETPALGVFVVIFGFLMGLSHRRILTILAALNAIAWCIASQVGAIEPDGTLNQVAYSAAIAQRRNIRISTDWLQKYIEEHWPGCHVSDPAIQAVQRILEEFGVLKKQRLKGGFAAYRAASGKAKPTLYLDVDLVRLLNVYSLAEKAFGERRDAAIARAKREKKRGTVIADLPAHRGAFVHALFEAVGKVVYQAGRTIGYAWRSIKQRASEFKNELISACGKAYDRIQSAWADLEQCERIGAPLTVIENVREEMRKAIARERWLKGRYAAIREMKV